MLLRSTAHFQNVAKAKQQKIPNYRKRHHLDAAKHSVIFIQNLCSSLITIRYEWNRSSSHSLGDFSCSTIWLSAHITWLLYMSKRRRTYFCQHSCAFQSTFKLCLSIYSSDVLRLPQGTDDSVLGIIIRVDTCTCSVLRVKSMIISGSAACFNIVSWATFIVASDVHPREASSYSLN